MIPDDLLFVCRRNPHRLSRMDDVLVFQKLAKSKKPGAKESTEAIRATGELPTCHGATARPSWRWDVLSTLNDLTPESKLSIQDSAFVGSLRRPTQLEADTLTKHMTKTEYRDYTDAKRNSSFTNKKMKRFREWLNYPSYTDCKLNEDVLELLGYLVKAHTIDMVTAAQEIEHPQHTHPPTPTTAATASGQNAASGPSVGQQAGGGETTSLVSRHRGVSVWSVMEVCRRKGRVAHPGTMFNGGRCTTPLTSRLWATTK